jgi:hypothetical protein
MHFVLGMLGVFSTIIAIFGVIELVLFLLRLHGPFTATGEALIFLATFGRRRPRFTWQAAPRQGGFVRDSVGIAAAAALGIAFWLVVIVVALSVLGPFRPVHEW